MKSDTDFQKLLDTITTDLSGQKVESDDKGFMDSIGEQNRQENIEYNNRNTLYTGLLEKYISVYEGKEKAKKWYKLIFFGLTMFLFLVIVVVCLKSMIILSTKGDGNLANVGIAITNIAGIVSTIIILPKTIADHLFPVDEEKNMIEMVKKMQENDTNIRDVLHKTTSDKTSDVKL